MEPELWAKVEKLYHAALEQPPEQRLAFLNRSCADQDLLREVKSLLEHQEAGDALLENRQGQLGITEEARPALSAGTRLGPYEILGWVGAGGMGEVYRARDARLGRDVAIKILPEHLSRDPQAVSRFDREARAVAALSHPNILAIFDVGNEQGITYAVTELLTGETLRGSLGRGALPWRKAVEIATEIAQGLSAAHSKGIIHRDLKPENIYLTADGQVKVLDFGLARWRPEKSPRDGTSAHTETQPGIVMGTVGHMSPEQVRGTAAEAPSDVFSFGCVLYEMIAGQRAFARETTAQTMTAILEQEPPPLAESGRDVPQELVSIVSRCVKKNPGERYQSAGDLSLAFRGLLSGPGAARLAVRSSWIRRKAAINIAAALLAVLIAAGVYWFGRTGKPSASIAVLPFVNASGNTEIDYLSDGITESLINSLSQAPNLVVMSRSSVFRYKGRDIDAQTAGQRLKVAAVLTGRVVQRGDGLSISAELIDVRDNRQLWGERYNRRLSGILAVEEEISTEISEKLRLRLTGEQKKRLIKRYTESAEAYQLYLQGRFYWNKKTEAGFKTGIEYFQKALAADPNYAPAYAALANLYYNLANYNFALMAPKDAWAKAKAAAEKALQIDDTLAPAHASLALLAYQWEWNWSGAEKEFKRALELDPSSSSTYEPSPSSTYHWYSHYLMTMGRTEEAIRAGRRAMELDPVDLAINAHQGWYYLWTREYDRAFQPLQRAIEMDRTFPVPQWYLGLVHEQKGAFQDAIAQFQNCVRITGGNRPSMIALLGHAYAVANRRSDAEGILKELSELSKQKYVPSYSVAAIYAALGDKEEALARLERAYDERDSWMDYLGLDPRLDILRSEPRFANLIRRMKLPAYVASKQDLRSDIRN